MSAISYAEWRGLSNQERRRVYPAPPTARQLDVLRFIAAQRLPPTVREIGDELGIASPNGVQDLLRALMRKGLLEDRARRRTRALLLTPAGELALRRAS